jgi:hypothetical protein
MGHVGLMLRRTDEDVDVINCGFGQLASSSSSARLEQHRHHYLQTGALVHSRDVNKGRFDRSDEPIPRARRTAKQVA